MVGLMTEPATATKPKRASALPPDERRSMIVAATLALLVEHGDRVTSKQIAEAAGVAEGTIWRAFADKDELIATVVEAALDPAPLESALRSVPNDVPFEDALAIVIAILQQRVIDIWRFVSSIGTRFHEMTRRPMVDSDALVAFFRTHREHITVEPIVAARLLRALTMSTTHPMLVGEPMSGDDIESLFLHGVATPVTGKGASC
jgi:AcrR family transcriptional regulator